MKNNTNGNGKKNHSEVTLEAMLHAINERISLLEHLKIALAYGFTSQAAEWFAAPEPTVEERRASAAAPRQTVRRKATPKQKVRGGNKDAILKALAGGPLTLGEVYDKMVKSGWKTTSESPKNMIGVTIRNMVVQGVVRKVGADYELAPTPVSEATLAEAVA